MRAPTNVYFVQAETLGLIKIGAASTVGSRLCNLQVGSPNRLKLLAVMFSENALLLEAELHGRFAKHRAHGEWFRPVPELLAFIATEPQKTRDPIELGLRAMLDELPGQALAGGRADAMPRRPRQVRRRTAA